MPTLRIFTFTLLLAAAFWPASACTRESKTPPDDAPAVGDLFRIQRFASFADAEAAVGFETPHSEAYPLTWGEVFLQAFGEPSQLGRSSVKAVYSMDGGFIHFTVSPNLNWEREPPSGSERKVLGRQAGIFIREDPNVLLFAWQCAETDRGSLWCIVDGERVDEATLAEFVTTVKN